MTDRQFELVGNNQLAFDDHTSPEILVAGGAGTGKTVANLLKLLWFGSTYPGARMLILRKTRKSLTESALVTWEEKILYPGHPIIPTQVERSHRHSYKFPGTRAVLVTGGMDDAEKVLSTEWDLIYVNEASELTLNDWEQLANRLRSMSGPFDQLFGDCNPTPPQHWLYQRCLAGRCKLYETKHYENPGYYDHRRRKWTKAGERYLTRLRRSTGIRRRRFLLGKWEAAEGLIYAGFVSRPWDAPENPGHLLPDGWLPPPGWKTVWSIDWGDSSPSVLQMWAVDDAGRMHHYREIYQTHLRPDSLGRWAAQQLMSGEREPEAVVCDHDPVRVAEFERGAGDAGRPISLRPADKRDRREGITAVQARFDPADDGRPRIFFRSDALACQPDEKLVDSGHPTCMIGELVVYRYDKRFLMDEPEEGRDHAADAMRYACRYVDEMMSAQNVYSSERGARPKRTQWDGGMRRKYGL